MRSDAERTGDGRSSSARPDAAGSGSVQAGGGSAFTYILRCADGTLYTGWTNDLEKRVAAHNAGTGAKYTKGRGPVSLIYSESFATKEEAMRREFAIKQLSREEKLRLAGGAGTGAENEKNARDGSCSN